MKTLISLLASVSMLTVPFEANAAFSCDTKVPHVLVYADGLVNVFHSVRNNYTVLCSLSEPRLGVTPSTCAMWTGMLLAIKKKDGIAQFWYNVDGDCTTMGVYGNAPVPTYIGDVS